MSLASLGVDIFRVLLGTLTFERFHVHGCKSACMARNCSPFETEEAFSWAATIGFFVEEIIESYLAFHTLNLTSSCRRRARRPASAFSGQHWGWAVIHFSLHQRKSCLCCSSGVSILSAAPSGGSPPFTHLTPVSLHSGWNCLAVFV